jgi:hypothetical protein
MRHRRRHAARRAVAGSCGTARQAQRALGRAPVDVDAFHAAAARRTGRRERQPGSTWPASVSPRVSAAGQAWLPGKTSASLLLDAGFSACWRAGLCREAVLASVEGAGADAQDRRVRGLPRAVAPLRPRRAWGRT